MSNEDHAGLLTQLTACADYFEKFYGRTKTVATIRAAATALAASEAEASDLRRKLEEMQRENKSLSDDVDNDMRQLIDRAEQAKAKANSSARAIETFWRPQFDELTARAETAERKLEEARKALEAEQALSALQKKMLDEAYSEIDAFRALTTDGVPNG